MTQIRKFKVESIISINCPNDDLMVTPPMLINSKSNPEWCLRFTCHVVLRLCFILEALSLIFLVFLDCHICVLCKLWQESLRETFDPSISLVSCQKRLLMSESQDHWLRDVSPCSGHLLWWVPVLVDVAQSSWIIPELGICWVSDQRCLALPDQGLDILMTSWSLESIKSGDSFLSFVATILPEWRRATKMAGEGE